MTVQYIMLLICFLYSVLILNVPLLEVYVVACCRDGSSSRISSRAQVSPKALKICTFVWVYLLNIVSRPGSSRFASAVKLFIHCTGTMTLSRKGKLFFGVD